MCVHTSLSPCPQVWKPAPYLYSCARGHSDYCISRTASGFPRHSVPYCGKQRRHFSTHCRFSWLCPHDCFPALPYNSLVSNPWALPPQHAHTQPGEHLPHEKEPPTLVLARCFCTHAPCQLPAPRAVRALAPGTTQTTGAAAGSGSSKVLRRISINQQAKCAAPRETRGK